MMNRQGTRRSRCSRRRHKPVRRTNTPKAKPNIHTIRQHVLQAYQLTTSAIHQPLSPTFTVPPPYTLRTTTQLPITPGTAATTPYAPTCNRLTALPDVHLWEPQKGHTPYHNFSNDAATQTIKQYTHQKSAEQHNTKDHPKHKAHRNLHNIITQLPTNINRQHHITRPGKSHEVVFSSQSKPIRAVTDKRPADSSDRHE